MLKTTYLLVSGFYVVFAVGRSTFDDTSAAATDYENNGQRNTSCRLMVIADVYVGLLLAL